MELHSRDYEEIEKKYVIARTKSRILADVLNDLEKYIRAIEEALLKYHQTKIKEINERIAELWMVTYQGKVREAWRHDGKDIESIEIESKAVVRGSKKYFEYAVYMTKVGARAWSEA